MPTVKPLVNRHIKISNTYIGPLCFHFKTTLAVLEENMRLNICLFVCVSEADTDATRVALRL